MTAATATRDVRRSNPSPRSICTQHSRYTAGCVDCRRTSAETYRVRSRLVAYGRWQGLQDVTPVREHLVALTEVGLSGRCIAEKSRVSRSVVRNILSGRQRQVQASTARALLEVTAEPGPDTMVSSLGTARRLQALMAAGWDSRTLAPHLGVPYQQVSHWRYRYRPMVAYRIHRQVAELYRRLECLAGPSVRAKAQARVQGYAPPVQWDDDGDIDNPQARPKGQLRTTITPQRRRAA